MKDRTATNAQIIKTPKIVDVHRIGRWLDPYRIEKR